MATARELLQQADALMRRNRLREAAAADPASDFPVLTDVFAAASDNLPGAPTPDAQAGASAFVDLPQGPAPGRGIQDSSAADVPILTEIVEDFDPISIIGEPADAAQAAQWPDFDDGELPRDEARRVTGEQASASPLSEVVVAPLPEADADAMAAAVAGAEQKAGAGAEPEAVAEAEPEAIAEAEPEAVAEAEPEAAGTSAPVPSPDNGDLDAARWVTLAEDVRMQVLQRIDIFTDTGLQEQLTARLQPIVDRASADLVATINQQVGQLLRGYVAEAIEREIEKWRHDGGA